MKIGITSLVQLSVYFDELDAGGVLYHASYIKLCDRARNIALAEAGCPTQSLFDNNHALAVVRCDNIFRKPLRMQDCLVASRLVSFSKRSLVVRHAIFDSKVDQKAIMDAGLEIDNVPGCYFSAETTLVSVHVKEMTSTPLPKYLRQALGLPAQGVLA
jgi:acyl-CoA thioester hydrolase